jgi:deoxyribonuclease-2
VFNTGASAFGQTIKSLYKAASPDAYAFYNDETPSMMRSASHAHMKVNYDEKPKKAFFFFFFFFSNQRTPIRQQGVLAIEGNQGFWLIHSVPRFPVSIADYNNNGYSFPDEETKYAQSFLCLTLNTATFETVAKAMLIDWPQIYDSTINSALTTKLPSLAALLNGQKTKGATAQYFNITTAAGKNFVIFAKNREWDSFLYTDFVAPTLNDGLFVESWQNGIGKIGSVCGAYKVFDIQNVSLPDGHWWKVTQDHSKWAITMAAHWSCVGDINREEGQAKRGGGTVCTLDDDLWTAFQQTIADVNKTCGHHHM